MAEPFEVMLSDIRRCPIQSLKAAHYRSDGTCHCLRVINLPGGGRAVVDRPVEPGTAQQIADLVEELGLE